MNPIGGQSDPREQERRLKLQEERQNDMKKYLASQAAMAHPRLKRLLKNRDEPAEQTFIEYPPQKITARKSNPSVPPNAEKLPPIPNSTAAPANTFYNAQPMYQPYAAPAMLNYGMYSDPRVNLPMPPPFYPVNWGYHNYQLPPPTNQPDPAFNLYGTYPQRDAFRPREGQYSYHNRHESVRSESRTSSQNLNYPERNYTSTKYQNKEQYAKELGKLQKRRNKSKLRSCGNLNQNQDLKLQINGRYVWFNEAKPAKNRNQYSKYNSNFGNERTKDPEFHDRMQQQTKYLKDLDEQIRVKNEMLQRQKLLERKEDSEVATTNAAFTASPYSTIAPELFHHSRKQFPDQQAKIFHSEVFPNISNRSPLLSQYSTLPPIASGSVLINNEYSPSRMMEQRNHNLSLNGSFPPSSLDFDSVYDPTQTKHIRGAMQVEDMPAWQKEEFLAKEQMKQKNQRDIQNVLKMQIAEKEQQKQQQLEQQRIEDEKERLRIENELNTMKEQYKREQEEDRKKAELEKLENERIQKEKLDKEKQAEMLLKKPLTKPKRVVRQYSPEPQDGYETSAPPFRSNSPPLPAVLKKMKEKLNSENNNYDSAQDMPQPKTNSPPIRSKHIESLMQESKTDPPTNQDVGVPPLEPERRPESGSKVQENSLPPSLSESNRNEKSFLNPNHEILEQLAAIQRELEMENTKLRQDIEQDEHKSSHQISQDPLILKVEEMERDTARIKSGKSLHKKLHAPYEPLDPPKRNSISSKFRKLKTPAATSAFENELFRTETQILDISNNLDFNADLFENTDDCEYQSGDDDFNIEEIEQRNEARLRKINLRAKTPKLSDKELLENFMNEPKKASIFSKLKKLTGSQPISATSSEELSSKGTVKNKKKTSLVSLNRTDSKNDDSATNSLIITKSQPVLVSDSIKAKSTLISSMHSLDVSENGTGSLHRIAEEPKSAAAPATPKSPSSEKKSSNSKVAQVKEIKTQKSNSPTTSDASLKGLIPSANQNESPLHIRKIEDQPSTSTIPRESVSSTRDSVKVRNSKNLSPLILNQLDSTLSKQNTPETPSPIHSARPSKTEKTLANEKLAERAVANELVRIVTQNVKSASTKSPDTAVPMSASLQTPKSPFSPSTDLQNLVSPSSLVSPDRSLSPLSEFHHKTSRSEQWPSKSEISIKPFLSHQNSANVSGMNTPPRSTRFDSTGSQNTVNVRGRAESSSQPSSTAPIVNRSRADSSVHTVQQQMKMRNELQRPRGDSNAQSFLPGHLKTDSGSSRSSVKAETPEDLMNRLRHAATQTKPAVQTSQQTMVDVTKNQSSSELGTLRKNSNAIPPKPTDIPQKPHSPFDKTPSGKNIIQNVPAKPTLPGKASPAGSVTKLEINPTIKPVSPFAHSANSSEQNMYVPSTPTKTLESQLQSLRNRTHSSSFGSAPPKPKDSVLRPETKGLTTINSANNSIDCLNPGSAAASVRSALSSQPGSTKNSIDNLSSNDKPSNEFTVEDNLHLVQCFKSEEDGLFKLSYGWYIEAYPDLKYNIWRRALFEIMQSQRDFPLLIPEELMAILNDEQMLD
ncbi:hypothetical protein HDV01_006421 [Terramyces sp. JEL0728]|nr:hypothetical protein HDV01_006421 [Terramyces sp. JEL0728]